MSSTVTKILSLLPITFLLLCLNKAGAQTNAFYTIHYTDSIQKPDNSDFAYNYVTITNVFGKQLMLNLNIVCPDGWNMLSEKEQTIIIEAGESYVLPLSFARSLNASASWTPVKIQLMLKNDPETFEHVFYIKAKARPNFSSRPKANDIVLAAYQDSVDLKLYIKNTGNINQNYQIWLKNNYFELNKKLLVTVAAGRDTNYTYRLKMTRQAWKYLSQERIELTIINDSGKNRVFSYNIKKISNSSKVNASAYKTFPIEIDGGISSSGNQISYYGGLSGAIKINDNSAFSFVLRSPQYGVVGPQQTYIGLTYIYKDLQVYAGQITDSRYFTSVGNGIRLTYKINKDASLSVFAIKHFDNYLQSSDLAGATAQYSWTKDIKIKQEIQADNFDKFHLQSYLINNELKYKHKKLSFSVDAGTGFDHYTVKTIDGKNDLFGTSLGYSFGYSLGNVSFSSSVLYNDDNYPGNLKGFIMHSHTIDWKFKSTSIGLFYQSTYSPNNSLKDSIFNTSYNNNNTVINISNYGIKAGWRTRKMAFSVGTGILEQLGMPFAPPHYQSFNFDYTYMPARNVNISLNSLAGYSNPFSPSADDIKVYIERANITLPHGGLQLLYSLLPNSALLFPTATTKEAGGYEETINFSPYLDMHFFKNALGVRLQYNMSKIDGAQSNNVSSFISYENLHKGYSIFFNSYMPVGNTVGTPSANLAFSKKLNVPLIAARKFYNLKIVLFVDENSNGKKDENEQFITNVEVKINGNSLLTDENGTIEYENVENGNYKLDFSNVRGLKGLQPTLGTRQNVIVDGNTTQYIAFKKSKYVYGNIAIAYTGKDLFTLDNFKITATDSANNTYTVLTDENGEYYLNLPTNKYVLSLNPSAFDETFRPVQISYDVDLINNEEANVVFKVVQKKREVNIIKANVK